MGQHYKKVCEFGFIHSQCRCIGPHEIRKVVCDVPYLHNRPKAPVDVPEPNVVESPHERVQEALFVFVEERFWYLYPGAQRDIVNDIEAALIKAGILAS